MDIGEEKREIIVVPVERPVVEPITSPDPVDPNPAREPVPVPAEPAKEPIGV